MKKLRFKNRNGILYFGIDDKFKSSKLKYNQVNKNIIIGKFKNGLLDSELGIDFDRSVLEVNDLLEEVLSSKSKALKYKTIKAYRVISNNNIIPYFDGKLVSEIKPIDIKKFHDFVVSKGLGKGTLNVARILLKEVFNLAIINEWCSINPIKMVDMPKFRQKKQKQKPFTLKEIDAILQEAKGSVRNFLGISFFTGMRSGELLALRWDDVDFITETISISRTIADGHINSAKTFSSIRDIEMIDYVKQFFEAQRRETGLKNSYLFLDRKNSYYGSNTYFYDNFQRILNKLEFETRSLHNTRHTFASLMLNNGIDPMWISNTLGHENLDITLKIYAHYMPRKQKMSIGFLEKRCKNGTNLL